LVTEGKIERIVSGEEFVMLRLSGRLNGKHPRYHRQAAAQEAGV